MSRFYGVYLGEVLSTDDPQGRGRAQIQVFQVHSAATWALTSVPPGPAAGGARSTSPGYRVGDTVWVAFEGGDATLPVVMGRLPLDS